MIWLAATAFAGGSPRMVAVIYNDQAPEAGDVAAHYLAARPGSRECPVSLDPTIVDIAYADYVAQIRDVVAPCLDEDVSYLVTVRGLPRRVVLPGYDASLEAVLQVWTATDGTGAEIAGLGQYNGGSFYQASILNPLYVEGFPQTGDYTIENPYQYWYGGSTAVIRAEQQPEPFYAVDAPEANGTDWAGRLFVVSRLDGFDYADADALIDRAIEAEAAPPAGSMLCMHAADDARGARDPECELAVRMLDASGVEAEWVPAWDGALSGRTLLGWFSGADNARDAIAGNTYAPGAMVDNLTSYGAVPQNFVCSDDGLTCPAGESQTSVARWVRAGASFVHGTVDEPLNNVFPNASAMIWYTEGYSAGESTLFAQRYLHWQNLWLGDPLMAPFAERPVVDLGDTVVPVGMPIVVNAIHPDGVRGIALWADGERVAEAEGGTLTWDPPNPAQGVEIALYVEAEADDVEVDEPGWPSGGTTVRSRALGWASGTVTYAAEEGGDTDGGSPKGCGCASGGRAGPVGWMLVAMGAVIARSRRRATERQPTVPGTLSSPQS